MAGNTVLRTTLTSGLLLALIAAVPSDTKPGADKTATLGGAERYLAYVSTDKPIYRAGEKVYVRGVVLRADNRTPLPQGQVQASIEIKGPKGDIATSAFSPAQDSVVGFAWEVPAGQAGGQYTVKMSFPWQGYAPAERKFDIRAYRAPRLKSQIVFVRDGYGPGDNVSASLHVERAEGGIPAGAKVNVSALVDGEMVHQGEAAVDAAGNCSVSFPLPKEIARGEGTLALAIEDGGVLETATKTIPILLQTVDLTMYPEGGDLVAGLENRVYVEARTPAKKPADIAGIIVDEKGTQVGTFRTEHEGRGRFAFKPQKEGKYTLRISEPAGIKTVYPLPEVKSEGVVLTALEEVSGKEANVRIRLAAASAGNYRVTLAKREAEVASAKTALKAGESIDLVLTPPATADGVLVATAWDEKGKPLAERLVFRQPARQLKVSIEADAPSYIPADKVTLRVKTTDEAGKPVGAVVGVTVTDDSVLEMIEKREQAPRLPVMVLLESDVRELADAHVYLDSADPKAPLAVDLLLGTQGWRRFAFIDTAKFLAEHGDASRRVLALKMATAVEKGVNRRFMAFGARGGGFGGGAEPMAVADAAMGGAAPEEMAANGAVVEERLAMVAPAAGRVAAVEVAAPAALPVLVEQPAAAGELQQALDRREAKDAEAGLMAAKRIARPAQNVVAVREYAHIVRPGRLDGDRVDFAETVYWTAGVKTGDETGLGTVSFALSDAVTTFRVFADAFDAKGGLGSAAMGLESVQPFYIEPKLPLEVSSGDQIQLPIAMVNGMNRDLPLVKILARVPQGVTVDGADDGFTLKGKDRIRRLITLQVGPIVGSPQVIIEGTAGPFGDRVARAMIIQALGFPVEIAKGGMLEPNAAIRHEIEIPANVVAESLTSRITVHPTPLGNLTAALERLIQEPYGCFEQTSSVSYPLVMAQQYFLNHTGVDPKLIERSREMLEKAHQKLVGFECKQRGYEWFGGDPGHEALTAYGLMQFMDMKQVRQVDDQMIQRTRQWLLNRRDGKGGFGRSTQALDSFGRAPEATTNAYVVWSLLESGEKGLEKEIASVKQSAMATDDSYVMALGANILMLSGDKESAKALMEKLAKRQEKTGAIGGAVTSITCSGGEALTIEATALTILAWLREPAFTPYVEKSMSWLIESCKNGRFGSTQSTILALRAIIHYDKSRARPKASGDVQLVLDGQPVGKPVSYTPQTEGMLVMPDISEMLKPGKHTVELRMDKGSAMPFSLAIGYHDTMPASAEQCKLAVAVALRDAQVQEGGITEARVTVTNRSKEVANTPVAIVGIPGGLEVRHDQLKELVKAGTIDAYEVLGRQVVLYWRGLKPEAKVELPISLVAAIPGSYTAPASRAYEYYTDEYKHWVAGVKVSIAPKP